MRPRHVGYALAAVALITLGSYVLVRTLLASDLIRSTVQAQLEARLGQPVSIGSASAVLFPRVALDFRDVAIGSPPAVALESVRLVTGLRGLLSRTVVDAEVIVIDGRISLPLPFPLLPAGGDSGAGPAAEPFTVRSVRLLSLRNVTLDAGGGREVLLDLASSLDDDRLEIRRLTVRAGSTSLHATGELTSIARLQGRLNARTDLLDITELVAIASALTAPDSAGASPTDRRVASTMRMDIALAATSGRFASYEFRDLSSSIAVVPGRVLLEPLSLRMFSGTVQGRLELDTGARTPRIHFTGRFEGLDAAELMDREGAAGITGTAGGTMSLAVSGSDADAWIRTARGTVAGAVTNGSIEGMDMVRSIVLAFGRPSGAPPEGSGSGFSRLGGTFALAAATVRSDDLSLESRDFDMAGRATVNLATGALDAAANVVLSPELTAQAGADLRRYTGEDGRIVVPATLTGTLQRARISLDIAAAAKRALGNELRRRTKSLLDDLFRGPDSR